MGEPMVMAPAPQGPPMMVPGPYMAPMNPYEAPYPSDLLSQIKMRNRRFQQSCAMEGMHPQMQARCPMMMAPPQMMMMMPGMPAQQPQMTEDMMMMGGMQDELSMIEQDLNMTRRATRFQCDEFLSADMLPAPKRVEPKKEEPEPAPKPAPRREVGIADQIAIRSYVLGKSIGKTSASE